ncbi:DNA-binding response regulator, NarL/FixJ family, contains REC and HTH domains [Georgenia satyanarayanai]|uniref:DNA-binding response regulator, NarL/FixJ family, contains REC and HTH domains n=2 Tax=Georgenia satyanarayanai TaxID=860221 RepID=A0A2Y9AH33_9MICO|nr:DNA-binding NarL/FixJ family response regulator [Georgenia satyanarayanai]SSA43286.1 DNA-binding response regulator, NarL/FixJ family, contains REC and HTH domains [Georgenia satyanarayanai]
MERVPVWVSARDPISEAGVVSQLRPRPEVRIVGRDEDDDALVAVVISDSLDGDTLRMLRAVQRKGFTRTVLVVGQLEDSDLVTAIEAGVVGLVRRGEATSDRLVAVIRAAATGDGTVPPDLLGRLMDQVGKLQRQVLGPRGLTFTGLASREIEVLRLIADGYDTGEVARQLSYSERTVKNVLHDVTSRLQLRNRSHAVAYALREGLI